MRRLRRLEHDQRGTGGASRRPLRAAHQPQGPRHQTRDAARRRRGSAAHRHRHRRVRSRGRRRLRAGIGRADRRRSGHRQVHLADRGGGQARLARQARGLCLGRGSDRPGAHARRTPRPRRRAGRADGRNQRRGRAGDAEGRPAPGPRGRGFDPDHVDRDARSPRPAPSRKCARRPSCCCASPRPRAPASCSSAM